MNAHQSPGTALVTGAAGAIGSSVVDRLLCDGFQVMATYHRTEPEPRGSRFAARPYDLRIGDPAKIVRDTVATFGELNVLVDCAAIIDRTPLETATAAGINEVLSANATAPLLLTRASAGAGLRSVVLISSIAERYIGPDSAAYHASKAALGAIARYLAVALAPIRVNTIAPGVIESGPADSSLPRQMLTDRIPVHRLGRPDDVAAAVSFLAGPDSSYITGQTLHLDGGLSTHLTRISPGVPS